jgi:hypothetical protein
MFIYIVINETNYPIGSFIEIQDARLYRDKNANCKIIKSTLVGNLPNKSSGNFVDKMKQAKADLPDSLKHMFGG